MPEATHKLTMRRHEACLAFSSAAKSGSTSRFFSSGFFTYACWILGKGGEREGREEEVASDQAWEEEEQGDGCMLVERIGWVEAARTCRGSRRG